MDDDDAVDGEETPINAVPAMNDGDIQQILRQFNNKFAKSKNSGVLTIHSLTL